MKNILALTILMTISNAAFAVAPFSGRNSYKVGDQLKYASQCVVRAQLDLGVQDQTSLKAAAQKTCSDLFAAAGLLSKGATVEVDMNGYSQTTVNCTVCAAE